MSSPNSSHITVTSIGSESFVFQHSLLCSSAQWRMVQTDLKNSVIFFYRNTINIKQKHHTDENSEKKIQNVYTNVRFNTIRYVHVSTNGESYSHFTWHGERMTCLANRHRETSGNTYHWDIQITKILILGVCFLPLTAVFPPLIHRLRNTVVALSSFQPTKKWFTSAFCIKVTDFSQEEEFLQDFCLPAEFEKV